MVVLHLEKLTREEFSWYRPASASTFLLFSFAAEPTSAPQLSNGQLFAGIPRMATPQSNRESGSSSTRNAPREGPHSSLLWYSIMNLGQKIINSDVKLTHVRSAAKRNLRLHFNEEQRDSCKTETHTDSEVSLTESHFINTFTVTRLSSLMSDPSSNDSVSSVHHPVFQTFSHGWALTDVQPQELIQLTNSLMVTVLMNHFQWHNCALLRGFFTFFVK